MVLIFNIRDLEYGGKVIMVLYLRGLNEPKNALMPLVYRTEIMY